MKTKIKEGTQGKPAEDIVKMREETHSLRQWQTVYVRTLAAMEQECTNQHLLISMHPQPVWNGIK